MLSKRNVYKKTCLFWVHRIFAINVFIPTNDTFFLVSIGRSRLDDSGGIVKISGRLYGTSLVTKQITDFRVPSVLLQQ